MLTKLDIDLQAGIDGDQDRAQTCGSQHGKTDLDQKRSGPVPASFSAQAN